MEVMRITITGATGAGKTSSIRAISEIDVVDTDRRATDETVLIKPETTVGLDFGRLTFASGQVLHLYGTPGQPRFDFMWDILIRCSHAYILLVAAHRPQFFRQSRQIFNFMHQKTQVPMIVGLTHLDCQGAWEPEDVMLALRLDRIARQPPFVCIQANEHHSVVQAILILLQRCLQSDLNLHV